MAQETSAWKEQVIPWEDEKEMEILSMHREYKWVKKSSSKFVVGVVYSIYQEPMLTYAFKNYIRGGTFVVMYVATQSHQFIFQKQKGRTDFFIDGDYVGYITPEWLMYSQRKRLLGRRNRFSDYIFTLIVWDREVAHLRDPRHIDRAGTRAYEITEQMNEKEQLLCMAMSFLTMLEGFHSLGNA